MRDIKVLVVDDSKVGRLTMQKKLESFGVGVDFAESGLEALNYLQRHRPDLIFMDHLMPDLDGFETTRRIKATHATRDIPVIIISGSDDETFVREARAIGALDAIAKPPANEAIERILVSLPHTAARGVAEQASSAPTPQTGTVAPLDQETVRAITDARIAEVVKQMRNDLLDEFRTRLEAEFANERQLHRGWSSQLEQRLDQAMAGQADITRRLAEAETHLQRLQSLESRIHAVEAVDERMASLLESVDQRVGPSLAELRQDAERQQAGLDALRQELLHRLDARHAQDEQAMHDLAGRVEALSEAMQRHTQILQTWQDEHSQGVGAIEQRLATLEAAASLPGVDQASISAALKTTLLEHLDHTLQGRNEALEAELGRLRDQLLALGQSQDALQAEVSALGEGLGTRLEARFAELRAELDAASRTTVLGEEATHEMALAEPSARSYTAEPMPMTPEVAAGMTPSASEDQDLEAQLAERLAEALKGRWQADVEGLQRRVQALTVLTAAGGAALLATLIILAL